LLRKYEAELRKLKGELQAKDRMILTNPTVQKLEEERMIAE